MFISSLENDKIKKYLKLKDKKYRDQSGLFIVEGEHLVLEAYKSGYLVDVLIEENNDLDIDFDKTFVSSQIINKFSLMLSPSKYYGICKKKEISNIGNKVLVLDGIQDPGNLGTIIRSAKAFNVDTIILSNDSVDLYNPKVLRATQGMIFYMDIIRCDIIDTINKLKLDNYSVLITNVDNGEDIRNIKSNYKDKYVLVMGNEGNGVSDNVSKLADKYIYINMNKDVESLNVSIATSILLYELGR